MNKPEPKSTASGRPSYGEKDGLEGIAEDVIALVGIFVIIFKGVKGLLSKK